LPLARSFAERMQDFSAEDADCAEPWKAAVVVCMVHNMYHKKKQTQSMGLVQVDAGISE
jgi:GT2 family glycosyltransferase